MKAKRIYLCGPMSGLPDNNYPEFHAACEVLREIGFHVENPAENPEPPCKSWQAYMRMAIAQLVTCDAVATLGGWEKSKGANVEVNLANSLGIPVMTFGQCAILYA